MIATGQRCKTAAATGCPPRRLSLFTVNAHCRAQRSKTVAVNMAGLLREWLTRARRARRQAGCRCPLPPTGPIWQAAFSVKTFRRPGHPAQPAGRQHVAKTHVLTCNTARFTVRNGAFRTTIQAVRPAAKASVAWLSAKCKFLFPTSQRIAIATATCQQTLSYRRRHASEVRTKP